MHSFSTRLSLILLFEVFHSTIGGTQNPRLKLLFSTLPPGAAKISSVSISCPIACGHLCLKTEHCDYVDGDRDASGSWICSLYRATEQNHATDLFSLEFLIDSQSTARLEPASTHAHLQSSTPPSQDIEVLYSNQTISSTLIQPTALVHVFSSSEKHVSISTEVASSTLSSLTSITGYTGTTSASRISTATMLSPTATSMVASTIHSTPNPLPAHSYANCSAALADTGLTYGQFTLYIQASGTDSIITNVTCRMSGNEANVFMQHNSSHQISWSGPAENIEYSIDYQMSLEDIAIIRSRARDCRQPIRLTCHNTAVNTDDTAKRMRWYAADHPTQARNFFPSSLPSGDDHCICLDDEACCCGENRGACDCDQKDNSLRSKDKGFLAKKEFLPVVRMKVGDVEMESQYGRFYLGPLLCVF